MIDNPLLDFSRLPRYASIRPEHVAPAIDELLARNRGLIATLCGEGANVSWDTFAEPLEAPMNDWDVAWGTVVHLHAVDDNAAIRDAYNTKLPKITRLLHELAQNLELYGKFKRCAHRGSSRTCPADCFHDPAPRGDRCVKLPRCAQRFEFFRRAPGSVQARCSNA